MSRFVLPQASLATLAEKYEALLTLRVARDETAGSCAVSVNSKSTMRTLSKAFPGCLKELDRCSQAQLSQRLVDLKLAQKEQVIAAWIPWIWRYHELLRVALNIKQSVCTPLSAELSRFATQCASPPNGRLVPLVLAQLAIEMNTAETVINETLFPVRR